MIFLGHGPRPGNHLLAVALLVMAALASPPCWAKAPPDFSRWDQEIAAFEKKDAEQSPPRNAIVFVGSSSIRLWDLGKSFPGMDVINRGFGGSEIADSVHFAPRIVLKYRPRLVVFYAGDNDLANGKTPEQVLADFQAFIKVVQGELPKTRIAFISIKPSIQRWGLIENIRQANALVETFCKRESLIYIDVVKPMLGADGKPRAELFTPDGLHLNDRGYQLWASIIKPILK